jgi:hypothetical protein
MDLNATDHPQHLDKRSDCGPRLIIELPFHHQSTQVVEPPTNIFDQLSSPDLLQSSILQLINNGFGG